MARKDLEYGIDCSVDEDFFSRGKKSPWRAVDEVDNWRDDMLKKGPKSGVMKAVSSTNKQSKFPVTTKDHWSS